MSSSVAFSVFNQIRILVTNLSKKNFKSSVSELKDLIRSHGDEAKFFLLKSLIEEIEYQDKSSKSWDHFKMLLLGQEITELSSRPNFASVICRSLEARLRLLPRYYPLIDPLLSILESQSLPSHFLVPFMRPLKLPLTQQLLIALGLAKSTDAKAAEEGAAFLRGKLLLLLENHPADLASGEGSKKNEFVDEKLPDSTLHELVFWIRTSSSSMASSLSSNQRTAVVAALAALYREQFAAPELAPLASLSNSGQMVDSSESLKSLPPPNSQLFDMIHARDTVSRSSAASASGNNNNSTQAYVRPCDVVYELGYGCMDRSSTLTSALAAFKGISEHDVACIIAVLCRTCSYLHPMDESRVALQSVLLTTSGKDIPDNSAVKDKDGNGWKADVFVHAMKELNPKLNWTEVMLRLDNNEFFVQDERSFRCLMNICKYANVTGVPSGPSQYRFPVEILYTPWRNQEGQLSLIKQVLLAQIPISPSSSSSGSSSSSSGSSSSSSSLPLNSGCIDIVSLLNAPSGRVQRSIDGLNWAPNVAAAMNKSASKGGAAGNPVRQHQQMFHCWYSVDFVENLLDMGERATMARVRDYKTSSSSGAGASATAPGENAEGKDDLSSVYVPWHVLLLIGAPKCLVSACSEQLP
jgi:hypothetical protein